MREHALSLGMGQMEVRHFKSGQAKKRYRMISVEVPDETIAGHWESMIVLAILAGDRTVREISARIGLSTTTTFGYMADCRRLGLIDWGDGKSGTLRATCRLVTHG